MRDINSESRVRVNFIPEVWVTKPLNPILIIQVDLSRRTIEVLVYWGIGLFGYRYIGVSVYWGIGIFVYWPIMVYSVLVYHFIGVSVY